MKASPKLASQAAHAVFALAGLSLSVAGLSGARAQTPVSPPPVSSPPVSSSPASPSPVSSSQTSPPQTSTRTAPTPAPAAAPGMECHTPEPAETSAPSGTMPNAPSALAGAAPRQSASPQQQDTSGRPPAIPLQPRPAQSEADAAESLRISKLAVINGVPYDQPSVHDTLAGYAKDTYGLEGIFATTFRALYSEARDRPTGWGQNYEGFGQRIGSSAAVTVINGNVRLGMELLFHEDLRYLPCNGCSARRKVENALLSEITARHDEDGHRFFTLTPTIADFSGPIIVHSSYYPGASRGPAGGVIATRTVFATRIGLHVVQEFFADPSKKAKKSDKSGQKVTAQPAAQVP